MSKPDYLGIAEQLKVETDLDRREQLKSQLYVFTEQLTQEEKDLFGYINSGYIENNPGIQGNQYASYVGTYYSDSGETT